MRRIATARDLGATIRACRKELHLSQGDVAASAGVSRQWLIAIEAGKATAAVGLVLNVLDVLGIDLLTVARSEPLDRAIDLDSVLEEYRAR